MNKMVRGLERKKYVKEYFENNYQCVIDDKEVDDELKFYGNILAKNVYGKVLDIGCGCSFHFNALFYPYATEIDGIDIVPENISFTKDKIKKFNSKHFKFLEKYVREQTGCLTYSVKEQIEKINKIEVGDFSAKNLFPERRGNYNSIISTYSLGCVKTEKQYAEALSNVYRLLKPNGLFIHLGTNGKNTNSIIPEITWNGLKTNNDGSRLLEKLSRKIGFREYKIFEKEIEQDKDSMYHYNKIFVTIIKK